MSAEQALVTVNVVRSDVSARRSFVVDRRNAHVVLDLVADVARQDPTLYFRYSCRSGFCGTCTVLLDGRPVLACQTAVPAGRATVDLAPLGGFPVIKDLVVDPSPFADRWAAVDPRIETGTAIDQGEAVEPADAEFVGPRPVDLARRTVIDASLDCISCGACYAACDVASSDRPYLGPAALTRAMVVVADPRDPKSLDRLAALGGSAGVEGCHGIGACSLACPNGLDPARAIRRLRRWRAIGHA